MPLLVLCCYCRGMRPIASFSSAEHQERAWLVLFAALLLLQILDPAPAMCRNNNGGEVSFPYSVVIEGAPSPEIKEVLLEVSHAVELADRPPPSVRLLERRAARDLEEFDRALESLGYFKAAVDFRIDSGKTPAALVYTLDPGPEFVISEAVVRVVEGVDMVDIPPIEQAGLSVEEPYTAKKVVEAQKRLIVMLGRRGHPFPAVTERRVAADFDTNSVSVEYTLDPGPKAVFGDTEIVGLETVDEEYVRRMTPWSAGQAYDVSLTDKARKTFFNSGLFSKVEIGHPDKLTGGRLPMTISVAERRHRTAKAGLEYNTDYGPGVSLGWEHRNWLGSGETLSATLSVNDLKRSLEGVLRKPAFLAPEQELVVKTSLAEERTEAFSSRSLDASGVLERDVLGLFTAGYGAGYRYSRVDDQDLDRSDTFGHAYFPLTVLRDRRDKILDPTRGYTSGFMVIPYIDTLGGGANFLKYRLNGSLYWEIIGEGRMIFAARALYGAITGAKREQVPADLRFHAGGGGTVRGYAYQTAGPLDDDDEPIGGKSMLVGGLELRFKVSEKFGVTPFLDGGRAYEDGHPDFDKTLFWGAGMGFQYYTGFGPIRIDVAAPLNRRDDLDEPFQLYVSLGHTF